MWGGCWVILLSLASLRCLKKMACVFSSITARAVPTSQSRLTGYPKYVQTYIKYVGSEAQQVAKSTPSSEVWPMLVRTAGIERKTMSSGVHVSGALVFL